MRFESIEPVDRNASWVTSSARLVKDGGSATVISLDGVRKAVGERWPKLRDTAAARLDQLLRERLGPADTFLPLDPMNFLVIMPKNAPSDGEVSCVRIAYELTKALAGFCDLHHLTLAPAAAIGDSIIEVEAFDADQLMALAEKAGLLLTPPETDTELAGDAVTPAAAGADIIYLPIWDADAQMIRAYRCQPPGGLRAHGPEENPERLSAITQTMLDLIQRGTHSLQRSLARGDRFVLTIPLSYTILTAPATRAQVLDSCRAVDASLRPYLAYSIQDLPAGIPQSRVAEIATILQTFCRVVLARASRPVALSLPSFRTAGMKALGISLKGLSLAACETEIAALTSETRRSGMVAFADRVDSLGKLQSCLARGVRWLSGSAVAPGLVEPGPLKSLPRMKLLKDCEAA